MYFLFNAATDNKLQAEKKEKSGEVPGTTVCDASKNILDKPEKGHASNVKAGPSQPFHTKQVAVTTKDTAASRRHSKLPSNDSQKNAKASPNDNPNKGASLQLPMGVPSSMDSPKSPDAVPLKKALNLPVIKMGGGTILKVDSSKVDSSKSSIASSEKSAHGRSKSASSDTQSTEPEKPKDNERNSTAIAPGIPSTVTRRQSHLSKQLDPIEVMLVSPAVEYNTPAEKAEKRRSISTAINLRRQSMLQNALDQCASTSNQSVGSKSLKSPNETEGSWEVDIPKVLSSCVIDKSVSESNPCLPAGASIDTSHPHILSKIPSSVASLEAVLQEASKELQTIKASYSGDSIELKAVSSVPVTPKTLSFAPLVKIEVGVGAGNNIIMGNLVLSPRSSISSGSPKARSSLKQATAGLAISSIKEEKIVEIVNREDSEYQEECIQELHFYNEPYTVSKKAHREKKNHEVILDFPKHLRYYNRVYDVKEKAIRPKKFVLVGDVVRQLRYYNGAYPIVEKEARAKRDPRERKSESQEAEISHQNTTQAQNTHDIGDTHKEKIIECEV